MSPRPTGFSEAMRVGGVYLGFTRGQWPIRAFSAEHRADAVSWAANDPEYRILVGPIPVPQDAPVYYAVTIPEHTKLQRVWPPADKENRGNSSTEETQ